MIDVPESSYSEKTVAHLPEFEAVVRARRSIRKFKSEAVPDNVIQKALDLALIAPNSSNLQSWEFYWVKTPELRVKLNTAFLSQPAVQTAPALIVAVARTRTWDRNRNLMLEYFEKQSNVPKAAVDYYKKLVPMVYNNGFFGIWGLLKSFLVALVGVARPVPREPFSQSALQTWAAKSCALACENLMLALTAQGYDSCPMEGMDSRRVSKALKLPRDAIVVMGLAIGKRADGGLYGPQIRFDSKLFIKEV